MIGKRIRSLRLARGWTQQELVARMGELVTKQAISKYESGKATPSARVIRYLARALQVQPIRLLEEPQLDVQTLAFRKSSRLGERRREQIELAAGESLRMRVWLQDRLGLDSDADLPAEPYVVRDVQDAFDAAGDLRARWALGSGPIANLIDVLEDHLVHVLLLPADEACDGLAVEARAEGRLRAVAIGIHPDRVGERQRLNLAHELGHLVLAPAAGMDEEEAAFSFGKAFLAPPEAVRRLVGVKRASVSLDELLMLKSRFGLSVQAAARYLLELGIISARHYKQLCIQIAQAGWRRAEEGELPKETPRWLSRTLIRAQEEELISPSELRDILATDRFTSHQCADDALVAPSGSSLETRLPLLSESSNALSGAYESDQSWRDIQGGDIIDYQLA